MWQLASGTSLADLHSMSDPKPNRAFSDQEEEFFRAGASIGLPEPAESFGDLDDDYRPRSIWRRLFGRKSSQP
jgi:hypothetical protein